MASASAQRRFLRRLLPWLLGYLAVQVVVAVVGRFAARRLDHGDESSTSIRRVFTHGGLELHPTNPALRTVEVDFAMGGVNLDLGGLRSDDSGGTSPVVELRVRGAMGGMAVRVPPDWRVWTSFRGLGGIGVAPGIQRAEDEHEADLRVRARVLLAGVGIETTHSELPGISPGGEGLRGRR